MSDADPHFKPLTEAEISDARQQFTLIDSDRNGELDEGELDSYFRQSKQELRCFSKLIIQLFGSDNSVSVDQYLKLYKALSADKVSDEFIGRYIFDYIDSDHNGTIEASEFQQVVNMLKFPPGMEKPTMDRIDHMNYQQFSKHFYILLKMAWRGLTRPTHL